MPSARRTPWVGAWRARHVWGPRLRLGPGSRWQAGLRGRVRSPRPSAPTRNGRHLDAVGSLLLGSFTLTPRGRGSGGASGECGRTGCTRSPPAARAHPPAQAAGVLRHTTLRRRARLGRRGARRPAAEDGLHTSTSLHERRGVANVPVDVGRDARTHALGEAALEAHLARHPCARSQRVSVGSVGQCGRNRKLAHES